MKDFFIPDYPAVDIAELAVGLAAAELTPSQPPPQPHAPCLIIHRDGAVRKSTAEHIRHPFNHAVRAGAIAQYRLVVVRQGKSDIEPAAGHALDYFRYVQELRSPAAQELAAGGGCLKNVSGFHGGPAGTRRRFHGRVAADRIERQRAGRIGPLGSGNEQEP